MDRLSQADEKTVTEIADAIYRLGGWGIASTVVIEGPEDWIIVDAGDNLDAALQFSPRKGHLDYTDQIASLKMQNRL